MASNRIEEDRESPRKHLSIFVKIGALAVESMVEDAPSEPLDEAAISRDARATASLHELTVA
jgi:hypothetical protein